MVYKFAFLALVISAISQPAMQTNVALTRAFENISQCNEICPIDRTHFPQSTFFDKLNWEEKKVSTQQSRLIRHNVFNKFMVRYLPSYLTFCLVCKVKFN